jgi:integral membrane sensor domain MASE1
MLVFGYKMWPGIFIGAYLLQRFVSFQNSMERLRDVIGLLLLGCTVGPAMSATIDVSTLGIAGLMPWSEYIPVWLT